MHKRRGWNKAFCDGLFLHHTIAERCTPGISPVPAFAAEKSSHKIRHRETPGVHKEERNMQRQLYLKGMREGIPVALGYFVVSVTIGIAARMANLTPAQATVMSLTNLTSAGQFASFGVIAAGAPYLEMVVSQVVINLRYCLMSCALSQKVDTKLPFYHRLIMSFGITDEIFGLSISQKGKLNPWYTYGAMSVAIPGWTLGTLVGILSTSMLPQKFLSAMNMALYGMFIAIFMPAARENKLLLPIIFLSMALSALFHRLPCFDFISSGMKIIILTLVISMGAALLFPVNEEEDREGK